MPHTRGTKIQLINFLPVALDSVGFFVNDIARLLPPLGR
jgi:hypothetical protein